MPKESFNLQIKVCSQKCGQCLFSPTKIVTDERKKEILNDLKVRQMHFFCHKGTINGQNVICYGSILAGHNKELLDKARQMGMLLDVDPNLILTNKSNKS